MPRIRARVMGYLPARQTGLGVCSTYRESQAGAVLPMCAGSQADPQGRQDAVAQVLLVPLAEDVQASETRQLCAVRARHRTGWRRQIPRHLQIQDHVACRRRRQRDGVHTTMRRAAIVAALLLALPASAGATPVKQYKPKPDAACRAHYVKRRETVKEHKHGKVVKVKETFCVYVAPKAKKPTTTTPTTTTPASILTLAAVHPAGDGREHGRRPLRLAGCRGGSSRLRGFGAIQDSSFVESARRSVVSTGRSRWPGDWSQCAGGRALAARARCGARGSGGAGRGAGVGARVALLGG